MAQKLGVSHTTIRKRFTRLNERGVILRYQVVLSLAMVDADYFLADVTTSGNIDEGVLVKRLSQHPSAITLTRWGPRNCMVWGEAVGVTGLYEVRRFLSGFDSITEVDIHFVLPVLPSDLPQRTRFIHRGSKVEFTSSQLKVLKVLFYEPRLPATEIAAKIQLPVRRVQRILQQLHQGGGVSFTIAINMPHSGSQPFALVIDYDEKMTNPNDVTKWFRDRYPLEYWNTWLTVDTPRLYHWCVGNHTQQIEEITNQVRNAPFIKTVEDRVTYPQKWFNALTYHKLEELIKTI